MVRSKSGLFLYNVVSGPWWPGLRQGTWLPVLLAAWLARLTQPQRAGAEDRIDYRFEDYLEDHHRMQIQTHSVGFGADLFPKVSARGALVYDAISGATPTGELPASGSDRPPVVELEDIRKALSLDVSIRYGQHTTTPQYGYSEESDYRSHGLSLTHQIDFNQKNTTLVLGAAHNFDRVTGTTVTGWRHKDTSDFMVGVNQLLSPHTVVSANLTLGFADGYLADPYRATSFILTDSPDPIFSDPSQVNPVSERRPGHRFKQVGFLSVTQGFESLHASLEAAYRPYHDDWGIWSQTVELTWFQKLGSRVILSPSLRYYHQTEADFYAPGFRGVSFEQYEGGTQVAFDHGVFYAFADDPAFPSPADAGNFEIMNVPGRPRYYSSDYRLSELQAFTLGIGIHVKVCEHFGVDLAYKRYVMEGLDGSTPSGNYPSADVFTAGCGFRF